MSRQARERIYVVLLYVRLMAAVALPAELVITLVRGPFNPIVYVLTLGISFVTLVGRIYLERGRTYDPTVT